MEEILYTIIVAIAFLIPGFIVTSIISRVIPLTDKEYKTKIFENFIYSFLNIFLWAIPIYTVYSNIEILRTYSIILWIIGFLIIFLSPIAIALVIILFYKYDIFIKLCKNLEIPFIDIEPSAWDFKFKQIENEWVLITLSDKRTVGGFIGKNSFISSNSKERDLYIDEVYDINEKGAWNKRERTDGIWLKSEEIKSIEFLFDKKD